jgi:hypothetical protein
MQYTTDTVNTEIFSCISNKKVLFFGIWEFLTYNISKNAWELDEILHHGRASHERSLQQIW